MTDTPEAARKKIMSATTDSVGAVARDYKNQPGIANLLDLLQFFDGDPDQFIGQHEYGSLKTAVADALCDFLAAFQKQLAAVDEQAIMKKLNASEQQMSDQAHMTLYKVQQAVGLRP